MILFYNPKKKHSAEGVCHRVQYCKAIFGRIHTGKDSHFQARFQKMVAKNAGAS